MATKKNTKKAAPKKKVVAKKPVKKAPAKKVAAKKPVKKTPAKKIVAKKPVKKAPAKKVVAKKPVKKAPAKKVVAKKPVKKAPTKKVETKKPVKKAPAKKVVAKKPVKKAPVKKVVAKKPEKVVAKKAPVVKAKKETIKVEKPVAKKVEKAPKAEKPAKVEKPAKEEKKPEMRMASKPSTPKKVTRGEKNSPFYKQPDIKALASINPAFKIHNARPNIIKPAVAKVQDTRSRYSDAELQEFKEIILRKLEEARKDLEMLRGSLSHTDDHGTDDTSPTFKMMEDGSETLSREETAQLAGRQEKFIMALENALIRIENKTYGVCRVTGLLIGKERLKLVPHTTLSIEAKNMQD